MTTAEHPPDDRRPEPGQPAADAAWSQHAVPDPVPQPGIGAHSGVLVPSGTGTVTRYPAGRRVPLPQIPADAGRPGRSAVRSAAQIRTPARRNLLVVVAVVVAMALAVVAVTVVRGSSGPAPRKIVEDLFAAFTARDISRQPLTGACDDNPLCASGALRTGYQPPEQVHIDGERDTGPDPAGQAQHIVDVSYMLDGRHVVDDVRLSFLRTGRFGGGLWSIVDLPGATVTVPGPTLATTTLAAATLPTVRTDEPGTWWAPPGVYTLTRDATPLFDAARTTVTVTGDTPAPLATPPVIATAVVDEVNRQVRDRIDACAALPSFEPDTDPSPLHIHSCPFTHRSPYTITDKPHWAISSYPRIHLAPAADGTITVTTTTPGQAAIHYQWTLDILEPRRWQPVDTTEDIVITGQVTAPAGTPQWTPT